MRHRLRIRHRREPLWKGTVRFSTLLLVLLTVRSAWSASPISSAQYRAQLQAVDRALQPDAPRAKAPAALSALTRTRDVQRAFTLADKAFLLADELSKGPR